MTTKERVSFQGRLAGHGHEADCTVWATKVTAPGGGPPAYAKYQVQDVSKALPEGDYQLFLSSGENMNEAEVITGLVQLLLKSGIPVNQAAKDDIAQLVATAQEGHLKEAKPIFQRLYGLATETVKQEAWAILTALITKAMGL